MEGKTMEQEQEQKTYRVMVIRDKPDMPNIEVEATPTALVLKINGSKVMNTMASKEDILVMINKEVSKLLRQYLNTQAEREFAVTEDR
jgi:hypothetical protein